MHFTYCPRCGERLIQKNIGDEGQIPYCISCKTPYWDSFRTCVICAVVNEEQEIALLRQAYVSKTNYVCVAGVIKLGESPEETAVREIKEEIGQDVEDLTFVSGYPYEKKDLLMLGYKAQVKKKEFHLSQEVDAVEWVSYENALEKLRQGSIAWQLVKQVISK